MRLRLKERGKVPPTGYTFREPVTGATLTAGSLEECATAVMHHRAANGIARQSHDEAFEDVETQLCQLLGPEWCDNAQKWGFGSSWEQIRSGTRTLTAWAFEKARGEHPYVDQETAEARAAACAKCFMNQRGGGCLSCGFVDLVRSLIAETTDPGRTRFDDRLNTCTICGCLLQKKVWLKQHLIKSTPLQQEAYEQIPWCWHKP